MINKLPIYLVSLEQDVQRRVDLKKRFPKYYDDFVHVPAVDGRKLSAKEYYDQSIGYFLRNNKVLSPGELGASLSHIKVLNDFIKSDHSYALIIEDDIIGCDSDIDIAMQAISTLRQSDFLLLGGQQGLNKRLQLGKKDTSNGLMRVSGFSKKFVTRACCYVVSRATAQHILDCQNKQFNLADKWDVFFKNTDVNIYFKDVFEHPLDLKNSHIEAERRSLDKSFVRKLFSVEGPIKIYNKIYFNIMAIVLKVIGFKEL